ncbi:MAG: hypothetical protein M3Y21_11285 [Candidatus Eremiobacteraeota bacterium]|nr:hypothetical protein [Candidatus Eremiobacteraeota bacterium]
MKLTTAFISIAFSATLALPLVALADGSAPGTTTSVTAQHPHRHHRNPFMSALHSVNLTADQKTQMKSLMTTYKQSHPKGSAPDRAGRKQLHDSMVNLLTPAQRTQFDQKLQVMRSKHKQMPGGLTPQATPTP